MEWAPLLVGWTLAATPGPTTAPSPGVAFRTRHERQVLVIDVVGPPRTTREQALADALALAGRRLAESQYRGQPHIQRALADPRVVGTLVVGEGRFHQRERDYGTTYQAALHLRLGPDEREYLSRAAETLRRDRAGKWMARAILMGMILMAVCVLYGQVNRSTHGYIAGRLRVAAVLVLGAGAYGVWQLV